MVCFLKLVFFIQFHASALNLLRIELRNCFRCGDPGLITCHEYKILTYIDIEIFLKYFLHYFFFNIIIQH